ncbi:MAG: glutamyl-tRNA reductase, partial [Actinomycetota bacterium]
RDQLDREAIVAAMGGVLAKLLHGATIRAKEAAASGDAETFADLCCIFGLDGAEPAYSGRERA